MTLLGALWLVEEYGAAVCSVSIATTNQWKDKATGERREETEWHCVVFYGRLAEVALHQVSVNQQTLSGVGTLTKEQSSIFHALKLKKPVEPEQLTLL